MSVYISIARFHSCVSLSAFGWNSDKYKINSWLTHSIICNAIYWICDEKKKHHPSKHRGSTTFSDLFCWGDNLSKWMKHIMMMKRRKTKWYDTIFFTVICTIFSHLISKQFCLLCTQEFLKRNKNMFHFVGNEQMCLYIWRWTNQPTNERASFRKTVNNDAFMMCWSL